MLIRAGQVLLVRLVLAPFLPRLIPAEQKPLLPSPMAALAPSALSFSAPISARLHSSEGTRQALISRVGLPPLASAFRISPGSAFLGSAVRVAQAEGREMPMHNGEIRGAAGTVVKEKDTGVAFPAEASVGSASLQLLGAGVRVKKIAIVSVKVYAAALYAEAAAVKAALGGAKGAEAVGQALVLGDFAKQIQIVLVRDISGDQFTDALKESLFPRLGGEGGPAVDQFVAAFKGRPLASGTRIFLTMPHSSTLEVGLSKGDAAAEGPSERLVQIDSADLVTALLRVYLEPDCPSPALREAVATGAASL